MLPEEASTYAAWMQQQSLFYVGKCNLIRKSKTAGTVERYKEHVILTFCETVDDSRRREKRYKAWATGTIPELFFLPFCWHNENTILQYERFLICFMQCPMQDRQKSKSFKTNRFRLWPRYRKKCSRETELTMNISHLLKEFEKQT